jgi:LacI family transcriptional regulator
MDGTRRRIGLLMDQSTAYGRQVHAGCRRRWIPRADIDLHVVEPSPEGIARLAAHGLDGVVAHVGFHDLVEPLAALSVPVVNVSAAIDEAPFPRVGIDDEAIGAMAAEYFLARRFGHFAYVGFPDRAYSLRREKGFAERLAAAGSTPLSFVWPREGDRKALLDDLLAATPPLAVLVIGDAIAVGLMSACKEAGIGIPDPLAICAGTEDDEICGLANPGLTAVEVPGEAVGLEAADLLEALLAGGPAPEHARLLPPERVIERASTNVEAVPDPEVALALSFIRAHADQPIGVDDVVKAAGVGRRNLERRFVDIVQRSIYQEVLHVRVERAKSLLHESDRPLDAVARAVGFAGAQHLCDVFKRITGVTPGGWRQGQGR